MFSSDEKEWSEQLFGQAQLGDTRRTARLVRLTSIMAKNPSLAVDAACGGDIAEAEGAHRLVRNRNFDADSIFDAGARSIAKGATDTPGDLLALEDTTTLSFSHSVAETLGDTGGKNDSKRINGGWWVHSVFLMPADTHIPLGPVYQKRWCRPHGTRGKRHQRRNRAYEQKESFKWEQASRDMEKRLGPTTMERTISVCDREADVFEYLTYKLNKNQRFVVRASWNRKVEVNQDDQHHYLWEVMEATPVRKKFTMAVPQKGGRPKRTANLNLRFGHVTLALPKFRRATVKEPLKIGVVLIKEDNPPEAVEPLEWMLLTTEPISTAKQAMLVLEHYKARWTIEDWHKAWKSGCAVEKRRQRDAANLEKVAVITGFIAIRLLQLRALANDHAEASCEEFLPEPEWKCLWLSVEKKALPERPPDIRWAHGAIGKLGGWKNSKRDGKIGWMLLYRGWVRLQERTEGFRLAVSLMSPGDVTK